MHKAKKSSTVIFRALVNRLYENKKSNDEQDDSAEFEVKHANQIRLGNSSSETQMSEKISQRSETTNMGDRRKVSIRSQWKRATKASQSWADHLAVISIIESEKADIKAWCLSK